MSTQEQLELARQEIAFNQALEKHPYTQIKKEDELPMVDIREQILNPIKSDLKEYPRTMDDVIDPDDILSFEDLEGYIWYRHPNRVGYFKHSPFGDVELGWVLKNNWKIHTTKQTVK